MAVVDRGVARSLAAALFLGIGFTHFRTIPDGFRLEGYIGVSLIIGVLMAVFGAGALVVSDRAAVWWYAVVEGVLNLAGYAASRVVGLPLAEEDLVRRWLDPDGLTQTFFSVMLTLLALWRLVDGRSDRDMPVIRASQRASPPPPRPKPPEG